MPVCSDINFPELETIRSTNLPIITICSQKAPTNITWLHEWKDASNITTVRSGKSKSTYCLHFPQLATFSIQLGSQLIGYHANDIPVRTLRHLLLDQVIPRYLGQLGQLILHGSSIVLDSDDLCIFCGDTGTGKSTLAASFLSQDMCIFTDDALLLLTEPETILGVNSYAGLRLNPDAIRATSLTHLKQQLVDHYSEKAHIVANNMSPGGVGKKVKCLFILKQSNEEVTISRPGAEDLHYLVNQIFKLDPTDKAVTKIQFEKVRLLTNSVETYVISYPRQFSKLSEVRSAVLGEVNNIVAKSS